MAATLPPIRNKNHNSAPGPSYGKPKPPPGGRLEPVTTPANAKGRRERMDEEKNMILRSQLPLLRKQDIAK